MKNFFKKVKDYIKNTAWIQPILIVVVIFVVLFSLSPITSGISKLWTSITTVNNMKTIKYSEYVSKVNNAADGQKQIFVFTDRNADGTAVFYKSMNNYLKSDDYKAIKGEVTIYNIDITQASTTKKINDYKCNKYKDSTIGIVCPLAKQNNPTFADKDSLFGLDQRLYDFQESFVGDPYSEISESSYSENYSFISGQLVMWYTGKLETRVNNSYTSVVSVDSTGKKVSASAFKSYIEEFDGETDLGVVSDTWEQAFDLTAQSK